MGNMSAPPGFTGEEAGAVPERATASDPLASFVGNLPNNAMSNIIPLDWVEISKALQTVRKRQMSDPQRAMQTTAHYNQRLLETTMEVWSDAASRFRGQPRHEEEEQKGKPDKRFSDPEWESNPYYKMLKETYLLTSEYLLEEAEETDDGREDPEEQRRLRFHLKQFVDAMAPVNFFLTNPAAIRRAMETGGTPCRRRPQPRVGPGKGASEHGRRRRVRGGREPRDDAGQGRLPQRAHRAHPVRAQD
jgi:polyhydroxyalkanoate synthase